MTTYPPSIRTPLPVAADVSTNGTEGEISAYTSAGDSSAKGVGVGVSVGTGVGVAVGTGVGVSVGTGVGVAVGTGVGVSVGTGVGVAVGTGVGVSVGTGVGVAVGTGVGVSVGTGVGVAVGLGVGAVRDVASTEGAEVSDGVDWLHAVNAIAAKVHTTNRPKPKVDPFGLAFTVMSTILPANTRRFNGSGRHQ